MTSIFLERLRPKRALAGADSLLIKMLCLGQAARLFGQQHIGVGAVGRYLKRLASELEPARSSGFPGIVHQLLCPIERIERHRSRDAARREQLLQIVVRLGRRSKLALLQKLADILQHLLARAAHVGWRCRCL